MSTTIPITVGLMIDFKKEGLGNYRAMTPIHEAELRTTYESALFGQRRSQVLALSTQPPFTEIPTSDIPCHPGVAAVRAKVISFRDAYNAQETGMVLGEVPEKITCVQYEYINGKKCVRYNYAVDAISCSGDDCPPPGADVRIFVKVCEDE